MAAPIPAESHDKRTKCGARTRSGGACGRPAGWGTEHPGYGACKLHLGSTAKHTAGAQRRMWADAAEQFGLPRTVDPADAILEALHKIAGQVDWFEAEVKALDAPWMTVFGGGVVEHPAVTGYRESLDRLFGFGERTVKLGLAQRQVEVSELHAALLARVVMAILDDPELALSREQRETGRRVGGRHLRQLGTGGAAA